LSPLFFIEYRKKSQTFKPHKNIPEGTKQYQLKKYAEATLGSGNLKLAVTLPEGEDINEWLAVNSTPPLLPRSKPLLFSPSN
jgi:MOB kinase activator 1